MADFALSDPLIHKYSQKNPSYHHDMKDFLYLWRK